MLLSKSVRPLPPLVQAQEALISGRYAPLLRGLGCAGAEWGCTGAKTAVGVREGCKGTLREQPRVGSRVFRCTHELTIKQNDYSARGTRAGIDPQENVGGRISRHAGTPNKTITKNMMYLPDYSSIFVLLLALKLFTD